jgi:hypothetical protein
MQKLVYPYMVLGFFHLRMDLKEGFLHLKAV